MPTNQSTLPNSTIESTSVLIVDDNSEFVDSLVRSLQHDSQFTDVDILKAYSAEEALKLFRDGGRVAVLVSDLVMPGMDGIALIELVRKISPMTVRVLISGTGEREDIIRAVNDGGVFHFASKPIDFDSFNAALRQSIWHYNISITEQELVDSTLKNIIKLLVDLLTYVDPEAHQRALRVREIVGRLCRRLQVKPNWNYEVAAMLAQFIAVNLPPELLLQSIGNEKLAEEHRGSIPRNAKTVYDMLNRIPRLEYVAASVLYQHKHFDGSGFPVNGIAGKKIVFGGRLLKVALDFELLTQSGIEPRLVLDNMHNNRGVYDPDLLAALDAEVLQLRSDVSVRRLKLRDLLEGMVLAFDVVNTNGVALLPANSKVTAEALKRLQLIARYHSVVEPVFVYRRLMITGNGPEPAKVPGE